MKREEIDNYMSIINAKCEKYLPNTKKGKLINSKNDDEISLPLFCEYDSIYKNNYNIQSLKNFAKQYKIKVSGNKNELMFRLFCFLRLSFFAVKIQKIFRGNLQRKFNKLHGPAYLKREICVNTNDFLTMEELKDIYHEQFFSYKDTDGFYYGFDIISLYNLISKTAEGKYTKNPYNRNRLTKETINDVNLFIKLGKMLNRNITTNISDLEVEISNEKSVELRVLNLFQSIDNLGNYSNQQWFLSLNQAGLIRFTRELMDIWGYRAQLSFEIKRSICPPNGDPFRNIGASFFSFENRERNLDLVRKDVLDFLEKLVNDGINTDSKSLGAYYILASLTLVNHQAALALPWLYQSVSYI